jgi:hypothetical protein
MLRISGACVCLFALVVIVQADEPAAAEIVKKRAQELGNATIRGDYAKVIDDTFDGVVRELGGRDKAIQVIANGMSKLKAKGITFKKYSVGKPGDFHREGDNTFVVVPTVLEMSLPGNRLIAKSYLLGISGDNGKSWKFVDGAGMDKKEIREKVLPKLPAKLQLPAKEQPKVVPAK